MKQHDEVNNYVSMLKVLYLGKNSERTIIRYIQGRSRITLGGKKKKKVKKTSEFLSEVFSWKYTPIVKIEKINKKQT